MFVPGGCPHAFFNRDPARPGCSSSCRRRAMRSTSRNSPACWPQEDHRPGRGRGAHGAATTSASSLRWPSTRRGHNPGRAHGPGLARPCVSGPSSPPLGGYTPAAPREAPMTRSNSPQTTSGAMVSSPFPCEDGKIIDPVGVATSWLVSPRPPCSSRPTSRAGLRRGRRRPGSRSYVDGSRSAAGHAVPGVLDWRQARPSPRRGR